ncbi:hypothetical protein FRC01_012266, partial [Tulasnella sp. 417]
ALESGKGPQKTKLLPATEALNHPEEVGGVGGAVREDVVVDEGALMARNEVVSKGKAKAQEADSDSQGEVNYDDLDEDSDDGMDEPGPSVRRTSSRRSKKEPGTQSVDLGMLESLQSMDIEGPADD